MARIPYEFFKVNNWVDFRVSFLHSMFARQADVISFASKIEASVKALSWKTAMESMETMQHWKIDAWFENHQVYFFHPKKQDDMYAPF